MQDYSMVNRILSERTHASEKKILNRTISVQDLSFIELGNILNLISEVISEDTDSSIYVANINGGFLGMNHATVVMKLEDSELAVAAYAREGLIRQHTSEEAVNILSATLKVYTEQMAPDLFRDLRVTE